MSAFSRIPVRRRPSERGSALLIVFVFAAIIAIYLYREIPQTLFEAKRQKEELLVERGHEYVRAVQLFYRKNRGQYPASFEQLESTNNMRFLRRRYVDPFTGKADWRILHAGPGGMLVDSKVTPAQLGGQGNGTKLGQTIAQDAGNAPASSTFGSGLSSSDSSGGVVVPPVPQRGPAVQANGGSGTVDSNAMPSTAQLDQDPSAPLLPIGSGGPGVPAAGIAGAAQTAMGQNALNNGMPASSAGSNAANVMQTMSPVVNNPTALSNGAAGSTFGANSGASTPGQINSGGFAGVASKATGHTIKLVAKQSDYSLWEFYYDPSRDTSMGAGMNQNGGMGLTPLGANGSNNTPNNNSPSMFQSGATNTPIPGQTVPPQPPPDSNLSGQPGGNNPVSTTSQQPF